MSTETIEFLEANLPQMSISAIARLTRRHWAHVYFGAVPYLEAMGSVTTVNDPYGEDSGRSIVAYFLANARGWRGDVAKLVKAELNRRIK